jgi:hypothetical protein
MAQSAIDDILTHHGVLGMKWGRRSARTTPQAVTIVDRRKRIKTTGGAGHPAHPDAVRVRTTGQIAKKSGVKALSDSELKAYTARLNLEQQAKRLQYEDSSPPSKFIKTILRQTGKQTAQDTGTAASQQVKKAVLRAASAAA